MSPHNTGSRHAKALPWLALLLSGCVDAAEPDVPAVGTAVTAVIVSASDDTLDVGETGRLAAVAVDASGVPLPASPVSWRGSDASIAIVAPDGVLTAIAPGTIVATATSGGRSASVAVVVRGAPARRAAGVDLLPRAVVLSPGAVRDFGAIVTDSDGGLLAADGVRFTSSDTAVALVDSRGRVVARAPGTARVEASIDGVATASLVTVDETPAGAYDVSIRLVGAAAGLSAEAARGAARWERVVAGDLPDVSVALPAATCGIGVPALEEVVDDLLVVVRLDTLDGAGGTIASASVCVARQESGLPLLGVVRLDVEDLPAVREAGALDDLLAHEIGHAMGLGTTWREPARGLLADISTSAPSYVGPNARRAASWLGFSASEHDPVPLEGSGGAGTRGLHWRESVFAGELMTGWLEAGAPLSAITVAALADLGYVVRLAGADAFSSLVADHRVSSLLGLAVGAFHVDARADEATIRR